MSDTLGSSDLSGMTPDVLRALMAAVANGTSAAGDDEDDGDYDPEEDDDDGDDWLYPSISTRAWVPPVTTEPQEAGEKLLAGGEFGYVGPKCRARPNHANVTRAILNAASKPCSTYTPKEELTTVWLMPLLWYLQFTLCRTSFPTRTAQRLRRMTTISIQLSSQAVSFIRT